MPDLATGIVRGDVVTQAIVIGGAGFIGGHLLAALVRSDRYESVVCVDIAAPKIRTEGVSYIDWDMRHTFDASRLVGTASEIFNLAAVHVTPGHADIEYFATNISCAVQASRLASELDAEHLTFISSIAIYGASEEQVDETSEPSPKTAYGLSKLQAEEIHRNWQAERPDRRRLTIVRPGVIYGPAEQGNFTRLARQLERRMFVYPGRSDTIKSCGYVKELVEAVLFMQRRNADVSLFNFCHSQPPTTAEICDALCAVGGFRRPRITIPKELMLTAALGMEALSSLGFRNGVNRARVQKLMHSSNVVPRRLQEAGYPFRFDLKGSFEDWRQANGGRRLE